MKNSDQITGIFSFVALMLLVIFFVIALAVRYRKRTQEHEALKARLAEERLKIKIEIQEQTLRHISRELHDNLGHIASLVKISLNTIDTSGAKPALIGKIESAKMLVRQLIVDLKILSVRLNSDQIMHNGFIQAVETEVAYLNATGALQASFEVADDFPEMETDKVLVLFRMVQEVLNNAVKHSGGSMIKINFYYIEKNAILELTDNGSGFDISSGLTGRGEGIANLRSRATLINADLTIKSNQQSGTSVVIRLL